MRRVGKLDGCWRLVKWLNRRRVLGVLIDFQFTSGVTSWAAFAFQSSRAAVLRVEGVNRGYLRTSTKIGERGARKTTYLLRSLLVWRRTSIIALFLLSICFLQWGSTTYDFNFLKDVLLDSVTGREEKIGSPHGKNLHAGGCSGSIT